MKGMGAGYLAPTRRIAETTHLTLEGFTLELAKAPGETPDHIVVWLADKRILFSGDNFYHAFPNLYAIRGTPYRDFDAWADTMDQLMAYAPEILAPGHTSPIIGAERIAESLTGYRDAIRYIVSETVAGMNAGLDPITIANSMELPPKLASKPYLQEFYGKLTYAVRAYYAGTLGWFDGDPTGLGQLAPAQEAPKMIALAGGAEAVLSAAQDALTEGDAQWAMELADRLIAANAEVSAARSVKITALRALADATMNAPTRNYYLLFARELEESAGT